jgi:hypothetical protein
LFFKFSEAKKFWFWESYQDQNERKYSEKEILNDIKPLVLGKISNTETEK